MKIIKLKKDLFNLRENLNSFSFVPTMGGLHRGHEILIKKAKKYSKKVVVSIFVNPKQFNSKKDFNSYPRNLKKDLVILRRLGVDYLLFPKKKDIFSFQPINKIYLHKFSKTLCGKTRPGHFKGVLNVVNRFIEILKPKYIFLGKKDFQQLTLIEKHIKKRRLKTIVVSCKTIRDKNYLPYSSRNQNLNKKELILASKIIKLIKKQKIQLKKNKIKRINLKILRKKILNYSAIKLDYLSAINLLHLKKAKKYNEKFNIFIAFFINKVRLIDNI